MLLSLDIPTRKVAILNLTNLTGFSKGEFSVAGKFTQQGLYWFVSSDSGRLVSVYRYHNGTVKTTLLSGNYKLYSSASIDILPAMSGDTPVSVTFKTFQNRTTVNQTILESGSLLSSAFLQATQTKVNEVVQICTTQDSMFTVTENELWRESLDSGELRKLQGPANTPICVWLCACVQFLQGHERQGNSLYGLCLSGGAGLEIRESTPRAGNWGSWVAKSGQPQRRVLEEFIIMGSRGVRVGEQGRRSAEIVSAYVEGEDDRGVEVASYGGAIVFNSSVLDLDALAKGDVITQLDLIVQGSNKSASADNTIKFNIKLKASQLGDTKSGEFTLGALNFKRTAASQAMGTQLEYETKLCNDDKNCQYHFWKIVADDVSKQADFRVENINRFSVRNYTRDQSRDTKSYFIVSSKGIDILFDGAQFVATQSGVYIPFAAKDHNGNPVKRLEALNCDLKKDGSQTVDCTLIARVMESEFTDSVFAYQLTVNTYPKFYGQFSEPNLLAKHSPFSSFNFQIGRSFWSSIAEGSSSTLQVNSLNKLATGSPWAEIAMVRDYQLICFESNPDKLYFLVLHSFLKLESTQQGVRMYSLDTAPDSKLQDVTDQFPSLANLGLISKVSCIQQTLASATWRCIFGSQSALTMIDLAASGDKKAHVVNSGTLIKQRLLLEAEFQAGTKVYKQYKNWNPVQVVALPTGFVVYGERLVETEADAAKFNPEEGFDSSGLLYYSYSGNGYANGGIHGLELLQQFNFSGNCELGSSVQVDFAAREYKKEGKVSLYVKELYNTQLFEVKEPGVLLRATTASPRLPKSLDLRVSIFNSKLEDATLKYGSLSFDSSPNGVDPAPSQNKLYITVMYAGAGFGLFMCLAVLLRYCTRSKELEKLEGDDTEPQLLPGSRHGVQESVVSMGMDQNGSENSRM